MSGVLYGPAAGACSEHRSLAQIGEARAMIYVCLSLALLICLEICVLINLSYLTKKRKERKETKQHDLCLIQHI